MYLHQKASIEFYKKTVFDTARMVCVYQQAQKYNFERNIE